MESKTILECNSLKRKKINWSDETATWLKENIAGRYYSDLANSMNDLFGLGVKAENVKHYAYRLGLSNGICCKFQKGQPSYNAGRKMSAEQYEKSKATMFKPGRMPHNYKPVGTEVVSTDGYIKVKIADPNKWKHKHVLVWEEHNGPIEKDQCILFLDGDKTNCNIENLAVVDQEVHLRMNYNRLRSGDPELTKIGVTVAKIINRKAKLVKGK